MNRLKTQYMLEVLHEISNGVDDVGSSGDASRTNTLSFVDLEQLERVKQIKKDRAREDEPLTTPTATYFEQLGFTRQLADDTKWLSFIKKDDDGSLEEAVMGHIRQSNAEFFKKQAKTTTTTPLVKYLTKCVCVDGTCAVGKSSLLRSLDQTTDKIGRHFSNFIARNTHVSSAIGYLMNGLKLMSLQPYSVWDRTPYNNVTWSRIWDVISKVLSEKKEEARGGDAGFLSCWEKWSWSRYANSFHPVVAKYFAHCSKTFLLIDSDEVSATKRLHQRGGTTDKERSEWPDYIRIQNFFYINMWQQHPESYCLIDINHYRKYICNSREGGDEKEYFTSLQKCVKLLIEEVIQAIKDGTVHTVNEDEFRFVKCPENTHKRYLSQEASDRESIRPLFTVNFTEGFKKCIDEHDFSLV